MCVYFVNEYICIVFYKMIFLYEKVILKIRLSCIIFISYMYMVFYMYVFVFVYVNVNIVNSDIVCRLWFFKV